MTFSRCVAKDLIADISQDSDELVKRQAVSFPKFTFGHSRKFAWSRGELTNANFCPDGAVSHEVIFTYLATRPEYSQLAVEWIVAYGKATGEFSTLSEYSAKLPTVPADMAYKVSFSSSVLLNSGSALLNLLYVTGFSGIGKSHIMLGAAAQLVGKPNVVIVYFEDPSELEYSTETGSEFASVVDYLACTFINYPEVLELIDHWYAEAANGTKTPKPSFLALLSRLSDHCKTADISPIFFFDDYTFSTSNQSHGLVMDAVQIAELGFLTVVSPSNPNHLRTAAAGACQMTITGIPTLQDLDNMIVAAGQATDLSSDDVKRMAIDLDYSPSAVVAAARRRKCMAKPDARVYANTPFHKIDDLQICINHQNLECISHISSSHGMFVNEFLLSTMSGMEQGRIPVSYNGGIISTENGPLHDALLRIKRGALAACYGMAPLPDSHFDLQFMYPLSFGESTHTVMHPFARRVICDKYFRGTAVEKFGCVFNTLGSKSKLTPAIRICYFDLALMETERLNLGLKQLVTEASSHVLLDFGRKSYRQPDVRTFDQAIKVAADRIELWSIDLPIYHPSKAETTFLQSTVLFSFPSLGFDEGWMGSELRRQTNHQGSIMLAITRNDMFENGQFTTCSFTVSWIINDPILDDVQQQSGFVDSWAGKAMRLGPHIARSESFGASTMKVRFIILAPQVRCNEILRDKKQIVDLIGIELGRCCHLAAIEDTPYLVDTLKNV